MLLVTHDIGTITDKVTHVACLNKNLHFHGNTKEFEELKMGDMTEFYGYDIHVLTRQHAKVGGVTRMIAGILQYEFLQNAFFTGLIIGIIAPLLAYLLSSAVFH